MRFQCSKNMSVRECIGQIKAGLYKRLKSGEFKYILVNTEFLGIMIRCARY